MTPVRRAAQVVLVEVGLRQFGDEHRRDAVERGAALILHRLQHRLRLEGFGGIDHRRAVRHAAQVAHDHAKAVIERHGDAEAVVLGKALQSATK